MKKLSLVSTAFAAFSLLGTNASFAEWKGYAGLNCMASNNGQDVRRSLSGTVNWQDTAATVYCPVVRDKEGGGPDGIKAVNVRVFNNSAREGGWCRLVSRTLSGGIHDWEHQSWPAGYADQTISFNSLDTANWGNIALYCSLPAVDGARKSFIRSYGVEEQ